MAVAMGGPLKRTQPVAVLPDVASDRHVDKRRLLEQERLARVLDPKVRTIGIDRQQLDRQIEERQAKLRLEAEADAWQQHTAVQQDKHLQALQKESDMVRAQRERDLVEYRRRFQKKQAANEWELNDPHGLKKDLPARIGDYDPRCTVSGMQKFAGEDHDAALRRRQQQDQLTHWVEQQKNEKRALAALEAEEERLLLQRREEANARVWQSAALQQQQRRQDTITTAEFNKQLAAQKKREAAEARADEQNKNINEIQNMLDSDLLCERGALGQRDKMKGLTPEQMQAIRNQQAQQLELLRSRKIEEAEARCIEAAVRRHEAEMGLALERQLAAERRSAHMQVDAERRQQVAAKVQKLHESKRLYAPEVGEQFFDCFQKSAR